MKAWCKDVMLAAGCAEMVVALAGWSLTGSVWPVRYPLALGLLLMAVRIVIACRDTASRPISSVTAMMPSAYRPVGLWRGTHLREVLGHVPHPEDKNAIHNKENPDAERDPDD